MMSLGSNGIKVRILSLSVSRIFSLERALYAFSVIYELYAVPAACPSIWHKSTDQLCLVYSVRFPC